MSLWSTPSIAALNLPLHSLSGLPSLIIGVWLALILVFAVLSTWGSWSS